MGEFHRLGVGYALWFGAAAFTSACSHAVVPSGLTVTPVRRTEGGASSPAAPGGSTTTAAAQPEGGASTAPGPTVGAVATRRSFTSCIGFDCKWMGLCTAAGSRCIAASDADCTNRSRACNGYGACWAEHGECVARSGIECEASGVCKELGLCAAHAGACWHHGNADADCVTPQGTRAVSPCVDKGRCRARGGVCVALSKEDCAASVGCKTAGECSPVRGECMVRSKLDCERSFVCKEFGECGLGDDECVAASDVDCRASTSCRRGGQCRAIGRKCGSH